MKRFRNLVLMVVLPMAAALPPGLGGQATSTAPATEIAHGHTSPGIKNVFWQPNELEQGSVAFFTVEFERVPSRVSGRWIGKELRFFKSPDSPKVWYALAGADLETAPGNYDLSVTAVTAGGKILRSVKPVSIGAANFRSSDVTVPENFVEPDAAEKKQIASDQVFKGRAFARMGPIPLWSGNFITPVNAKPTDTFGMSRLFNEELTSTHRGTDFPIAEGAPVAVSNSGTIVLAREMFYEGNCVIVDHGDRFFTIYMHMSKIEVKVGDKLKKGDRVGLTGKTGRVTGPHLHMGVRWNGAYLDPTKLLALTLPKLHADDEKSVAQTRTSRLVGVYAGAFLVHKTDRRERLALEQVYWLINISYAEVFCEGRMPCGDGLVHEPCDAAVGEVALRGTA
jgi:murein DD-endopeptidase MepM/ murein hydrolase activator NlpD